MTCSIELVEIELFVHQTVCIYKMCLQIKYLIHIYKDDFALNNLQWLICHKSQLNQIIYI